MSEKLRYSVIQDSLNEWVPAREPEMQVMEQYAAEHHFPIVGPVAGYHCYQVVRAFTRQITTDSDWIVSLVPVRDGLIIAYKK